MLSEFRNYQYLCKHDITRIEDLVGRDVYFVFPTQGVKRKQIRKVTFHMNNRKWFVDAGSVEPVENLGAKFFLDEDEATEYQMERLKEYTKQQQERIIRNEVLKREKEIKELERLLEKYPDEESRKLPIKCCITCEQYVKEYPDPHTCDECTSLDNDEPYTMWSPNLEVFKNEKVLNCN